MPDYLPADRIKKIAEDTFTPTYRADKLQAFFGADPSFYLPSYAELKTCMDRSFTFGPVDLGAGFDCDDYAYALKGTVTLWNRSFGAQTSWCVGVIFARFPWMGGVEHAANWFIDKSGTLRLLEPQTKREYSATNVSARSIKLLLL